MTMHNRRKLPAFREYLDQAEERAKRADSDLMADKSAEIKLILESIRQEKADHGSTPPLTDLSG